MFGALDVVKSLLAVLFAGFVCLPYLVLVMELCRVVEPKRRRRARR